MFAQETPAIHQPAALTAARLLAMTVTPARQMIYASVTSAQELPLTAMTIIPALPIIATLLPDVFILLLLVMTIIPAPMTVATPLRDAIILPLMDSLVMMEMHVPKMMHVLTTPVRQALL